MSENNKKIKSIKTYNAEYSSNIANITENKENIIIEYEDNMSRLGHFKKAIFAKDEVEIEYEKPKILKRPDGSVISGLEEGQKVISIKQNKNGKYEISGYGYDDRDLLNGFVFLEEDIHLAETKAEMLTKKFEIQCEIDRLNAENSVPVVEDREFAFKVDEY